MRILLLSAYHTASHRHWCDGLIKTLPKHKWTLLTLEDRYFRYRIRGNPLSWSQAEELSANYDLIVATSMVDLATLKGLFPHLAVVPSVVYFHENQFSFPSSERQHQSVDPQMVNLYSAMAADQLLFNSQWNRDSFFAGVERLLKQLPDRVPKGLLAKFMAKSQVLAVPIANDLQSAPSHSSPLSQKPAAISLLWAARWEYDKGPDRLLLALRELEQSGLDYRLNILGQQFRKIPEAFDHIEREFSHRIDNFGYQMDRQRYIDILQASDVFISTAIHEFQGLSAMEAVACGCIPVLPERLSYPEIFGDRYCYRSFPDSQLADEAQALAELVITTAKAISVESQRLPRMDAMKWSVLAAHYEACFLRLAKH